MYNALRMALRGLKNSRECITMLSLGDMGELDDILSSISPDEVSQSVADLLGLILPTLPPMIAQRIMVVLDNRKDWINERLLP
jgi:hypothetical protein